MTEGLATPPRRSRRESALFWLLLVGWIAILGLVLAATAGLTQIYYGQQILAGVQSLGQDLTGRTPDQAAALLSAEWDSRNIVLQAGELRWALTAQQLGIALDAEQTARAALAQARNILGPDDLWPLAVRLAATTQLAPVAVDAITVPPAWSFDREAATRTLRTLAGQVDVEVEDAGVRVVEGRVVTTPAVTGQALDIAAILARLERYPWASGLADPTAPDPVFEVPVVAQPPAIADMSELVAQVQPLLASPITVRLYDAIRDERDTWSAFPEDLGGWLSFAISGTQHSGKTLTWSVDEEAVAAFVREQNSSFADERYVDLRAALPALTQAFRTRQNEVRLAVSHGEREHVVKPGETLSSIAFDYGMPYPWIQAANPGAGDVLFVGDRLRIPSPDVLLPLPVVEGKRITVSLTDQTMEAYEDDQLKWSWITSTGIASSPTSPGVFQVQSHEEIAYAANWDLYMPWFIGIYQPVPGQAFMNGFHGFPSRDRVQLLWTRNLGRPVTYGCLLLSTENAKLLYEWAELGVVVEIVP